MNSEMSQNAWKSVLPENTEEQLPEWAKRKADEGEIAFMQQAYTKDGSRHGNAVITEVKFIRGAVHFSVVTEAGNIIQNLNYVEFFQEFTPGKWIMKGWPTTESEVAWFNRHVS